MIMNGQGCVEGWSMDKQVTECHMNAVKTKRWVLGEREKVGGGAQEKERKIKDEVVHGTWYPFARSSGITL